MKRGIRYLVVIIFCLMIEVGLFVTFWGGRRFGSEPRRGTFFFAFFHFSGGTIVHGIQTRPGGANPRVHLPRSWWGEGGVVNVVLTNKWCLNVLFIQMNVDWIDSCVLMRLDESVWCVDIELNWNLMWTYDVWMYCFWLSDRWDMMDEMLLDDDDVLFGRMHPYIPIFVPGAVLIGGGLLFWRVNMTSIP